MVLNFNNLHFKLKFPEAYFIYDFYLNELSINLNFIVKVFIILKSN